MLLNLICNYFHLLNSVLECCGTRLVNTERYLRHTTSYLVISTDQLPLKSMVISGVCHQSSRVRGSEGSSSCSKIACVNFGAAPTT
jgi:hypothetical protein